MQTIQGTMWLRPAGTHWWARLACALTIAALVGIFSYAATYRALVVISTPSGTTVTPGTPSTTVTSTAPAVSLPRH